MTNTTKTDVQSFLVSTFFIEDTRFGIDTSRVQEIIKVIDITNIHHAPEYIMGAINLRGKIVTIMNLGRKLVLSPTEIDDEARIMIADWGDEYVGLLVDKVSDVIVVERERIKPAPSNVKGAQGRYFEGVYETEDGLVGILNVDEVLVSEEK